MKITLKNYEDLGVAELREELDRREVDGTADMSKPDAREALRVLLEAEAVPEGTPEAPVVPKESTPDSPKKAAYRNMIERYKVQNPVKYEAKAAVLQARLEAIA